MATLPDFLRALHARSGFEAAQAPTVSANQIYIIGRVPPNQLAQWLVLMDRLLEHADDAVWNIDLSKNYVRRKLPSCGGKMVYCWRLVVSGEQVQDHLAALTLLAASTPLPARQEVMEMPLHGVSANRNEIVNGSRGVGPVGKVKIGVR